MNVDLWILIPLTVAATSGLLLLFNYGSHLRVTPKPSSLGPRAGNPSDRDNLEGRMRTVEAEQERLHKEWLRLSRQFAKARYDDQQAQQVPQNGAEAPSDIEKDPRYSQYFD